MREYHYRVDGDGRVFHDGSEIVDAATLRFFLLGMRREADGRWLVPCQGEQNWFTAEDTPFVIQRLRLEVEGGRLRRVGLGLAGGLQESLDPATLEVEDGRLHCRVRRGAFRARFGRLAVQQLAPYLEEQDGRVTLWMDGARHVIAEARAETGGVHVR
jgi:Protein of unknown function (DUF1285)